VGNAATGSPTWSKGNLALADLQNIRGRLAQVLAPAEQAYVTDTQNHAQIDARDGVANRPEGERLASCYAHIDRWRAPRMSRSTGSTRCCRTKQDQSAQRARSA
jgi:hypothetical protein